MADDPDRVHLAVEGTVLGDVQSFISLALDITQHVRATEPDTSGYRWSLDESGSSFYVEERYSSSVAFLQHMRALRSTGWMDRLTAQMQVERVLVWQAGNDEARHLLDRLSATYLTPISGW